MRDAVVNDKVVEISAITQLGNLCVDVPAGVEVELVVGWVQAASVVTPEGRPVPPC
jgi:hypothetical protein